MLNLWKEIYSKEFFELKHPTLNHITTRAVASFLQPNYQVVYIFFVDKEEKYIWLTLQSHGFGDFFITQDSIYIEPFIAKTTFAGIMNEYFKQLLDFIDIDTLKNIKYKNIPFGICFNQYRPAHALKDDMYWFDKLSMNKMNKEFFDHKIFFKSKTLKYSKTANKNLIYISPRLYIGEVFPFVEMEKFTNESLQDFNILVSPEDKLDKFGKTNLLESEIIQIQEQENDIATEEIVSDLTLWIGLPGEKRIWLDQWQGVPLILKNLKQYFKNIKVYIDGNTAYHGERIEIKGNLEDFEKISHNLYEYFLKDETNLTFTKKEYNVFEFAGDNLNIKLKSLSGYDYRTKICYCSMCDMIICDINTTAFVPLIFLKKLGVYFSAPYLFKFLGDVAKLSPHSKIIKRYNCCAETNVQPISPIPDVFAPFVANFHISPEHLYNLAAEFLEKLSLGGKLKNYNKEKPLKMHRLYVHDVRLYAFLYEVEKSLNADEKKVFQKIKEQLLQIQIINFNSALRQIHNHLSYKLGSAMIINSKSFLGYILMPYVLIAITIAHKTEQKIYKAKITKDPSLKFPPLEECPDYQESLKEKECFTYQLGLAFIKASKTWYKGGLFRFFFKDLPRLRRELKEEKNEIPPLSL